MEGLLRRSCTRRNAPGRNPLGLWAGAVLLLLSGASASGCLGYLMGWPDAEVKRLRRVTAEVEAKNAELVEEVLRLRRRLDELESSSAAPDDPVPPGSGPARSGTKSSEELHAETDLHR